MFTPHPIHPVAAAWLLACLISTAQASAPLQLREALQLAEAQSQQLAAQDAQVSAAREMAVAAGQLPDPVLSLGIDNLPISGPERWSLGRDFMTMRRIGISQEMTSASKRQARTGRQQQEALLAQAQKQQVLANLQTDTALAWLDRHYRARMHALVQQQVAEAQLQVEAAEIAFRSGAGTQSDVFAARTAVIGLQDREDQLERQSRRAADALARWIGVDAERKPGGSPPWRGGHGAEPPTPQDLGRHPALGVVAAQIALAQADVQLAQANTEPDWTLAAAFSQRGPGYSNMFSLGVSIPLQWDRPNRQGRELAARLALLHGMRAQYEDMHRAREAEFRSLRGDWSSGIRRVDRYEQHLLPVARQRIEAALTAYRTGNSDLATVLAARRDALDQRLVALGMEMDTARLWAQLYYQIPDLAAVIPRKEQP